MKAWLNMIVPLKSKPLGTALPCKVDNQTQIQDLDKTIPQQEDFSSRKIQRHSITFNPLLTPDQPAKKSQKDAPLTEMTKIQIDSHKQPVSVQKVRSD